MRSRPKNNRGRAGAFVLLSALACAQPTAFAVNTEPPSLSSAQRPTEADMRRALEKVKADPNLGMNQEVTRLQWVDKKKPPPKNPLGFLWWLRQLFVWIATTGRILLWVAVALAGVLLVLYLTKFLGNFEPRRGKKRLDTPTHVRDLDIRPESLPANIGAAARELWERGEHRSALSLLYRGLLSRLAHAHAVPIAASSTEGDCLALAEQHLSAERVAYVVSLVKVWQRTVYGGRDPDSQTVNDLCDGFSSALDRSAPPQAQSA